MKLNTRKNSVCPSKAWEILAFSFVLSFKAQNLDRSCSSDPFHHVDSFDAPLDLRLRGLFDLALKSAFILFFSLIVCFGLVRQTRLATCQIC